MFIYSNSFNIANNQGYEIEARDAICSKCKKIIDRQVKYKGIHQEFQFTSGNQSFWKYCPYCGEAFYDEIIDTISEDLIEAFSEHIIESVKEDVIQRFKEMFSASDIDGSTMPEHCINYAIEDVLLCSGLEEGDDYSGSDVKYACERAILHYIGHEEF
jgi:hypothetical protein